LEITTAMIKALREETGAGVLDCRKALVDCDGDVEAAITILREKGLAAAAERADRQASEGLIEVYAHPGNRVAVMLELNCETDFVANTDEFRRLAHDLALHIAFAAPIYLTREDIPEETTERKRADYRIEALEEGKPERIVDRIVEGKLNKFYDQVCLMGQPFVKDEDRIIKDLIDDVRAKLGEKIVLRRFVRYELGQDLEP
jgi:elongation factor Ts